MTKNGTMITAMDGNKVVTRNSSRFKKTEADFTRVDKKGEDLEMEFPTVAAEIVGVPQELLQSFCGWSNSCRTPTISAVSHRPKDPNI